MPAPRELFQELYELLQKLLAAAPSTATAHVLECLSIDVFKVSLLGAIKTYLRQGHTKQAYFDRLEQLARRGVESADDHAAAQVNDAGPALKIVRRPDGDLTTAREQLWMSVLTYAGLALQGQESVRIQRLSPVGKRTYVTVPVDQWTNANATRALFQHLIAGLEEECGCSLRLDAPPPVDPEGNVPLSNPSPAATGETDSLGNAVAPLVATVDEAEARHAQKDLTTILGEFGNELRASNLPAYFAVRRWYWFIRYTRTTNVNQEIARLMMRREGKSNPTRDELVAYAADVVNPLLSAAEAKFQKFCALRGYAHLKRGDVKDSLRSASVPSGETCHD